MAITPRHCAGSHRLEDDLSREYRELARSIPPDVHLGKGLNAEEFEKHFPRLFQYIDLSNEQVFLRINGRISKTTWQNWSDGIRSNLALTAFKQAWERTKEARKPSFKELRELEERGFSDPRLQLPRWKRFWQWLLVSSLVVRDGNNLGGNDADGANQEYLMNNLKRGS